MKRILTGLSILIVLLILSVAISAGMHKVHYRISDLLQQAEQAASADNWQDADRLARYAAGQWQQYRRFTAAFADHTPMDELDGLFAELLVFLEEQEVPHFTSICARLSLLSQSMADSHSIRWWDVL